MEQQNLIAYPFTVLREDVFEPLKHCLPPFGCRVIMYLVVWGRSMITINAV